MEEIYGMRQRSLGIALGIVFLLGAVTLFLVRGSGRHSIQLTENPQPSWAKVAADSNAATYANPETDKPAEVNNESPTTLERAGFIQLLANIEKENERYTARLSRVPRSPLSLGEQIRDVIAMGHEIRETIYTGMEELQSFTRVRRQSEGVITWRELPPVISFQGDSASKEVEVPLIEGMEVGRLELPLGDTKPIVIYKHVEMSDGAQLLVLQNAFVIENVGALCRLRLIPYALVVENGEKWLGEVQPQLSMPGSGPWVGGNYAMILDTYPVRGSIPWVGIIRGPAGSGQYLHLELCAFSEEEKNWSVVTGGEWDDISDWAYDSGSASLSLTSSTADGPVTWSQSVRDIISKYVKAHQERSTD